MKYLQSITTSLISVLFLTGCEVPVMIAAKNAGGEMTGAFKVTLPAVVLVRLDTGEEDFLTGNLVGHVSGKSEVKLTGPKTGVCIGRTNSKGFGSMSCTNGLELVMDVDTSSGPKMSGAVGQTGEVDTRNLENSGFTKKPVDPSRVKYVAAFGWGKIANDASVRSVVDSLAVQEFGSS